MDYTYRGPEKSRVSPTPTLIVVRLRKLDVVNSGDSVQCVGDIMEVKLFNRKRRSTHCSRRNYCYANATNAQMAATDRQDY